MIYPIYQLSRNSTALAIVDIQERLVPAIFEHERFVRKAAQLVRGCVALDLPIVATEQNPRGLGPTITEVASLIPSFSPVEKMAFSACGAPAFVRALRSKNTSSVIVCGIEAHVCVTQTCLDLLRDGFRVFVVEDAISSRTVEDWRCGLRRVREAGAVVISVEMALFELLKSADCAEFKEILRIVK